MPVEDIYRLIKRLQPNCLVMDLNAAKYPREALFYTDIKSYEQGAGQKIDPNANRLPALSCRRDGKWVPVADGKETRLGRVSILRFHTVWGDAVRVSFSGQARQVSVAELGVYNERR